MGDFKSDYMKRNDNREVKDIFTYNGYKQLLKSPTRVTRMSATLVDVTPTNITLHYITLLSKLQCKRNQQNTITK